MHRRPFRDLIEIVGLAESISSEQEQMTINEYVGSRLKALRLQRGVDPERLASIADITLERYAAYELGKCQMPFGVMLALAIEFEVEITYFLEGYELSASGSDCQKDTGQVD